MFYDCEWLFIDEFIVMWGWQFNYVDVKGGDDYIVIFDKCCFQLLWWVFVFYCVGIGM